MALPPSGTITASMINTELGRVATVPFNMNDSEVRKLAGKPTGAIAFSDFWGKSNSLTIAYRFTTWTHKPTFFEAVQALPGEPAGTFNKSNSAFCGLNGTSTVFYISFSGNIPVKNYNVRVYGSVSGTFHTELNVRPTNGNQLKFITPDKQLEQKVGYEIWNNSGNVYVDVTIL